MNRYLEMTLHAYGERLTGNEPTPGSASAAALAGSHAAALGTAAAVLTYADPIWEAIDPALQEQFREAHEELVVLQGALARMTAADIGAAAGLQAALALPKGTAEERAERKTAVEAAAARLLGTPLKTAEHCLSVLDYLQKIATCGERGSLPEIGTASALAFAGLDGSLLNVRCNLAILPDERQRAEFVDAAERMWERGNEMREETMAALFIRLSAE